MSENLYWELKLRLFNVEKRLIKDDTENQLKLAIKYDLINEDLSPKHCINCGNNKFKDKIKDTLDGVLTLEYESYCTECDKLNGYWAHGFWLP